MSAFETTETGARRRRIRLRYLLPAVVALPLVGAAIFAAIVANAKPSLRASGSGLATITTPFGTGTVERVSAVGGIEQKDIPVALHGRVVWPTGKVAPGARIQVEVIVKRPGWISWLAGSTERLSVTETAPVAEVASRYITHSVGKPLTVRFQQPVTVVGSGDPGTRFDPHALSTPQNSLQLSTTAAAGSIAVAAAVRTWETPSTTTVTWFPRGKRATVVASPAPGTRITPTSEITLTFSKPVNQVLGNRRPPVNPITPGVWHTINARTIVFKPTGYGYGLGASVKVLLPATVYLMGAKRASSQTNTTNTTNTTTTGTGTTTTGTTSSTAYPVVGTWTVPQPSTLALKQLLAQLGYLPVKFTPDHVAQAPTNPTRPTRPTKPTKTRTTPATNTTTTGTTTSPASTGTTTAGTSTTGATTTTTSTTTSSTTTTSTTGSAARAASTLTIAQEETAVTDPVKGRFSWRYRHTPAELKQLWSASQWTELTKGAVMSFEQTMGLPVDGEAGPQVWKALIKALVDGQRSSFGYTFVMVSEHLPESIQVWHDGKVVVHGLVNTGISVAPTAVGTYAVYEHLTVTTMSGVNPDGTPYHDPGIPWVSYFNGGDALHGFIRASYGFPQSLGCVEMPFAEAGQVWPYTPIGTIVHLTAA